MYLSLKEKSDNGGKKNSNNKKNKVTALKIFGRENGMETDSLNIIIQSLVKRLILPEAGK